MRRPIRNSWLPLCAALCAAVVSAPSLAQLKTRNVVLIVSDGLRWQEVFTGADRSLLDDPKGGMWESADSLKKRFWDDSSSERRRLLMPFMWDVIAKQGQLFGNQEVGSIARVTNGVAYSYPGYNEMLTGHPDPRIDRTDIDGNNYGPNPNVTVFEWLNQRPGLEGKSAVFGSWTWFTDVFNESRSHLDMRVGSRLPPTPDPTPRQALLERLYRTTTAQEEGEAPDAFVQARLLDYLHTSQPRALFVGFGETDDWGHAGRYDLILEATHHLDLFVHELWDTMQSMPQYRGQTTFIITTDHGRGSGLVDWKEHGIKEKGSENIWIATIGPDTAPLGERHGAPAVEQAQIAATIAALLGQDYRSAVPLAAPPLPVLPGN
ncbi:MAG TPA: hypothetical protein VK130_04640 [Steroidobacteraceae bacterium]|nr:hypothetical protein [Steroidobacteraceae bacterium]